MSAAAKICLRKNSMLLSFIVAGGKKGLCCNRLIERHGSCVTICLFHLCFTQEKDVAAEEDLLRWVLLSFLRWLNTLLSLTSPSRVHGRPFWGYLTWVCLFFWPPSANLHSNGSAGATEWVREREREGDKDKHRDGLIILIAGKCEISCFMLRVLFKDKI